MRQSLHSRKSVAALCAFAAFALLNCLWLVIALAIWSGPTVAQGQNAQRDQIAESTLPPPVEVWNVMRSNLSIVRRVEDLPESVRAALAKALHQDELKMGDHDHEVGHRCPDCVVYRLIFAGFSSEGCFVHYSAIGLGASYDLIVFDTKGQKGPRPLWAARGVRAGNLEELRSLIAEGKFHPYPLN